MVFDFIARNLFCDRNNVPLFVFKTSKFCFGTFKKKMIYQFVSQIFLTKALISQTTMFDKQNVIQPPNGAMAGCVCHQTSCCRTSAALSF